MPADIKIVEVGPRDGLQNEANLIAASDKVALVDRLSECGLQEIETGSFVSPKWVPQMATSAEVFETINRKTGVVYSALAPNLRGLDQAIDAGVDQVAIFAAASEAFSQTNINCSIEESIARFTPLVEKARSANIPVRAYISCVMGCPYEGSVDIGTVIKTAHQMMSLGCVELSLGDTIGVGTPFEVKRLLAEVLKEFPVEQVAMHFHDTYGQALANTFASVELGIRTFDASVAGLGGCPYAKGASGNVSTEDMVYMFEKSGLTTGIDLDALIDAGNMICEAAGKTNQSHVASARRGAK